MFKALLLTKTEGAAPHCAVTELGEAQLPAGDVLVHVSHSTLNYKDGLAITGKAPVVRTWPMVPGIDFAGTVLASDDARYRVGDAVLLNGWGVGETHWGGLAQKARVKADWLVSLPAGLTTLKGGTRVEFGVVDGKKGKTALSLKVIEPKESVVKAHRKPAEDMAVIVETLIRLLDDVGNDLRRGRYPNDAKSAKVAAVLRAVATDLDA